MAAHLGRLLAANRQPQPGSAKLVGNGVIGLLENIEDFILSFLGDAGAGVGHRSPDLLMISCRSKAAF